MSGYLSADLELAILRLVMLWVAAGAVAFLVGRFAPLRRDSLRRIAVPAALATLTGLLAALLPAQAVHDSLLSGLDLLSWLLVGVFSINAVGLMLFDVILPRFWAVSRLVHDLTLGAAYFVLLMVFLRRYGVDFSSVLATSAVVTAIVAISMQATLGNAFGGLMLQLDQSIREGDWVRLGDGSEGRVRAVRWRHTVIETRNWDTLIVPNSALMAEKFLLLGKREGQREQHRMWVYFNVDYRFSPADVIDAVEKGLRAAPIANVASQPPPNCVCMDLIQAESSIRYAVRYWLTDLAVDDPTSSVVRGRIFAALRRAKIPLAVPAATLFIEKQNRETLERKRDQEFQRRLAAVSRMPLCRSLTEEEREHVARNLKFSPFAAGEVITREGADAHFLYILDRGTVEISVHQGKRELAVAQLQAPDYFGEHGMLTGAPRAATVAALSEVECYRLDREALDDLLQSRPALANDLANVLAQRQEDLHRSREALAESGDRISINDRQTQILGGIKRFFGLD